MDELVRERMVGGLRRVDPEFAAPRHRETGRGSGEPDADRPSVELGEEPADVVELFEKRNPISMAGERARKRKPARLER